MKALLFLCLLSLVLADSCGGNCPSGKCRTCYCGNNKNTVDIASWCSRYSWDQTCCRCIISHESGGNAHAVSFNENGSSDVGLWQINNVYWGECNKGQAPCSPNENLNCAIKLYGLGGNSWNRWSTHTACGC